MSGKKVFCGPSKVRQSFKNECDINYLMKQYQKNRTLPTPATLPVFADFSKPTDYMQAVQIVLNARAQFDMLDSGLRERLGNDPAKFLEYVNDPNNLDEMIKLGLAVKKEVAPVEPPKDDPNVSK